MFIGIRLENAGSFRVDSRKSIVQYFDNKEWKEIKPFMIKQAVNDLKGIYQLSFRHLNHVFEIEMPKAALDAIVLYTKVDIRENRLLEKDIEFKIDDGTSWEGLFDADGNLTGITMGNITVHDLYFLCNLSKDIINISLAYYINQNFDHGDIVVNMIDIIKLAVDNNDYISTIECDIDTPVAIVTWLSQGRPLPTDIFEEL